MHLLDINVLIALVDPAHAHHQLAGRWFRAYRASGWSTCPITENGLVRILSREGYPGGGNSVEEVREMLTTLCASPGFVFWSDDISIRNPKLFASLSGSKNITDSYLLALAAQRGGRLVTFDRKLSTAAVAGGSDALWVLSADRKKFGEDC